MFEADGVEEPSKLEEALTQGSALAEAGDAERALQLLLGVEPEHPDDPTLLCMLGALSLHEGADGMAVDFFRRCLAQDPTDPVILVTAGSALAAAGDPAAEPALRLAVVTAPESASARMHFGAFLVRSGLGEQGIDELLNARKLDPDEPGVHRELGMALLLASREAEAIEAFEAAVDLDEEDVDGRLLLGLARIHAGEMDRAAEDLHPLGNALPADSDVQLLLALTFAVAGWEDEAWLALSRAEAAPERIDSAYIQEVEEALEGGEDAVHTLLVTEVAPSLLRDRIFRI